MVRVTAPGLRRPWFTSLTTRLLAAFTAVTLGAIAVVTAVGAVAIGRHTATLQAAQREQLRTQVASALSAAYAAGRGTWTLSDLSALQATADAQGLRIVVLDANGHEVGTVAPTGHDHAAPSPTSSGWPSGSTTGPRMTTPTGSSHDGSHSSTQMGSTPAPQTTRPVGHGSGSMGGNDGPRSMGALPAGVGAGTAAELASYVEAAGPPAVVAVAADGASTMTVPIVVGGVRVGTAELTLPATFDAPITQARDALLRSLFGSAALALALAVGAALFVSRRLSRPVVALTAATRAVASGHQDAENLLAPGPGELGELARAFATMATALRRQDELRRSVVADVAHELRTPVTILRGQTEQLLDGIEDPTPARLVSLHDEVLRLERLTDDLATLSAADAAGVTIRPEPVDLADVVRRADDLLRPGFDEAGLTLHTLTDAGSVVMADDLRLTQVVTNLLTNAAKFTPAGGAVTMTVRREGSDILLVVEDTGPGIPAEELPHVFERFWRGRQTGGRRGTGIGLAVVDALVRAHGGVVTAESPPSGGARFAVRLPATSTGDPGTPAVAPAAERTMVPQGRA